MKKIDNDRSEIIVSIVTPSYNQAEYIEETILSIINQTYPFVEHIIIDGASTDGTLDILRKYEGKIIWRSEADSGETEAVNKGIKMATGELIGWVCSDNTLQYDAVNNVVSFYRQNHDVDMISGGANIIDKNGKILETVYPPKVFSLSRLIRKFGSYGISEPSTFIKKSVLEEVGLLDPNIKYANEIDLYIRIGMKFNVRHIHILLANVRRHSEALTLRKSKELRAEFRILGKKYLKPSIPNLILLEYLNIKRYFYHELREKRIYYFLQRIRQKIRGLVNEFLSLID